MKLLTDALGICNQKNEQSFSGGILHEKGWELSLSTTLSKAIDQMSIVEKLFLEHRGYINVPEIFLLGIIFITE